MSARLPLAGSLIFFGAGYAAYRLGYYAAVPALYAAAIALALWVGWLAIRHGGDDADD